MPDGLFPGGSHQTLAVKNMKINPLLILLLIPLYFGCAHSVQVLDEYGQPFVEGAYLSEAKTSCRTGPTLKIGSTGKFKIPSFYKKTDLAVSKRGYKTVIFHAPDKPKIITLTGTSEPNLNLSLMAFIDSQGNGDSLILRITNHGDEEVTVLTADPIYMLGTRRMTDPPGECQPDISLWYVIFETEKAKIIPSLPDLSPVTLKTSETAVLKKIELDADFMKAITDYPNRVIPIRYTIHDNIAERFGLWRGTIEMKAEAHSMINNWVADQGMASSL